MESTKIGVLIADKGEFEPFKAYFEKYGAKCGTQRKREYISFEKANENKCVKVKASLCGIGKVNSAAETAYLINEGCSVIVNFGFSGGIDNIKRSSFCLCESFLEHDFDLTPIGYPVSEKPDQDACIYYADKKYLNIFKSILPDALGGCAVTGDTFISSKEKCDYLKKTFGAVSCDMETASIASVCYFADVPFTAVRKISDNAQDGAEDDYRKMNTSFDMSFAEIFDKALNIILGEN